MRIRVDIELSEIKSAIRAYLLDKGVPLVAVDKLELAIKTNYDWDVLKGNENLRARVEFDAEAFGSGPTPLPEVAS